jgi:hypothetical protein
MSQKVSKTLGNAQSPYIVSLMRLIETQSKPTLCRWATGYVKEHILPVYERAYPADPRPRDALNNAIGWLEGRVKFADAKKSNNDAHTAATEAEGNASAQAAARAAAHAALTIHVPTHCLGIALYGAAALAYAQAGIDEKPEVCEEIAARECAEMEASLRGMAVPDEPNPAKIDWNFWSRIMK